MKSYRSVILIFILFMLVNRSFAQNNFFSFKGYLSNMQTVMFEKIDENWLSDHLIHNRLNFKWYISDNATATVEMRNRFIYGDFMKIIPGYSAIIEQDQGWMNLSVNLLEENSFLLNSNIDRAYLDLFFGKLQIRTGRQRINWGRTFAWNPNDIFNAYSFFDFDYVEKPGSDAVLVQYYTGFSSVAQAAVKIDRNDKVTAAGLFQFNKWGYDFQFLGGILNSDDWVIGAGWEGDISGAGFRGEMSWFRAKDNFSDTSGTIMLSLSGDYTFKNSLNIRTEFLYNGFDQTTSGFSDYYFQTLSVKNISFTDYSVFTGISYPFNPLFNGSFSFMLFPSMNGYYIGPDLSLSLTDNMGISFILQHFSGEFTEGTREKLTFAFLRLKWSFAKK
ncbi:MAG: hypothetical protein IIB05_01695 [Bacteroidetes bacterium]|nr:hypothetical protein [Bacteroidota bacterium]